MHRLISKSKVDKAKKELGNNFISRIVKNVNDKGCWYLGSHYDKSKPVDSLVHFSERGTKKIFFKAKRFSFEYFKGDLEKNFAVYSKCDDKYCTNPDHLYKLASADYLNKSRKTRINFKHSPETITKISKSNTGKKATEQAKHKMSLAKLGVKRNADLVAITAEKYFRGENNGMAKLTTSDVLNIRKLQKSHSSHEVAQHYPVTAAHIRSIWRGDCWSHI